MSSEWTYKVIWRREWCSNRATSLSDRGIGVDKSMFIPKDCEEQL